MNRIKVMLTVQRFRTQSYIRVTPRYLGEVFPHIKKNKKVLLLLHLMKRLNRLFFPVKICIIYRI